MTAPIRLIGLDPGLRQTGRGVIEVTPGENLGFDTSVTTIQDPAGRPQYLSTMDPIAELV